MNLIVACDRNFAIGNNGKLLCNLPEDMRNFKDKTSGKVVIMGRKTAESLPNKKPLKNRRNIILTRNKEKLLPDFEYANGLANLLTLLANEKDEDVWVIGGGEIYKLLLPYCNTLYITEIDEIFSADTYFINYKSKREWIECKRSKTMYNNDKIPYSFVEYKRKIK